MDDYYNSLELDEWLRPMSIAVGCKITDAGDEPIQVKGCIPTFRTYREAERFLGEMGFSFIADEGKELGIVYEGQAESIRQRFGGRLVPYSELR